MAEKKTFIVGIGASAGGLEAITQLISSLSSDIPCAYVVLQHLSPGYRSMMVEILSRETSLRVKSVEQAEAPVAGTIYVVPPNSNAVYRENRLSLITAPPEVVPKPSVNEFLISLAAEEGENAIGIVLSGTGSDGVAGLRAIQAAGGFSFAQKPETAKYDGMPRSAIEAGVVDYVLKPDEFASQLTKLLQLPDPDIPEVAPTDLLEKLLSRVRERLQFDFSGYKVGTLMRRICRRQVATGNKDLATYLDWVEQNPHEIDELARDILISVTAFFRDRDAFDALRRAVFELCNRKAPGAEIRVWVAGCASGEEAYSISMLFADALGDRLPQYRVQIFATDLDDAALNVARRGIYPAASMAEVPEYLLTRFFIPANNTFEANKVLRDMIVFARHNLVSDPPFLRLDLVSCRNVLIYFDAPLQAKVLRIFHFGLGKGGYLFLGRSESVAQAEQLFVAQDRRERLFSKSGIDVGPTNLPPMAVFRAPNQRREHKVETLLNGLSLHFDVTAALCEIDGNILHTVGRVEQYLQFPVGATRMNLAEAAVPALRGELLRLLHQLRQSGKAQKGRRRKLENDYCRIFMDQIRDANGQMLLVLFRPEAPTDATEEAVSETVQDRALEDELLTTREHLQALVEEMATANEEMQALNEESQASNEELQATNEELEAANEELQATNEELVSLNEELNVKTNELGRLSDEYAHLYDALQFPILVFNRNCQLIRFNASAARRFDLRPTAQHQRVAHLRLPADFECLEGLLASALAHSDVVDVAINSNERILRLMVTPGLDRLGDIATLVVTVIDVTDISLTQAALAKSEARLTALMEHTTVIFAMKDIKGEYLFCNRRFIDFFRFANQSYNGKNDFELFDRALAGRFWSGDLQAMREQQPVTLQHELEVEGQKYYLRSVHQVLLDDNGQPSAFVVEAEDITPAVHADEQLRLTARIFDQVGEAIAITDATGVILNVNAAFTQITGYMADEALNRPLGRLLKSGRHGETFYEEMWRSLNRTGFWQGEIWNKRKNGDIFPEWLTINRVNNQDGDIEHFVAVFSDISAIRESDRKANYLATHDPLTTLPNRTLFNDRLQQAVAQTRRLKSQLALLFIDLDNFKVINDTLGHDIGDELIRQAAQRLQNAVRDMDTIARLGGDEFTTILRDCTEDSALDVANRIVNDLSQEYSLNHHSVFVSASVGIAFFPDDGQDVISLVKSADTAMYSAKERGRNRVELFRTELRDRLFKQNSIETGLRQAILDRDLRLVFQPKFHYSDVPELVGAEALLRWHDPEMGEISPAEFIPIAEASSLVFNLNNYVMESVLKQLVAWRDSALEHPTIAVNLSPHCIHKADYADNVLSMIQRYEIEPTKIQVEITESALLENTAHVIENLRKLRSAGIEVAIDDFGTGYSSLSYLKRIPLSYLKIDKSFVSGLGKSSEDEAIALAVIQLAKALGLKTVAEGVETEEQVRWLGSQGCEIYQGYLLGKPMEIGDFQDLIRHRYDLQVS